MGYIASQTKKLLSQVAFCSGYCSQEVCNNGTGASTSLRCNSYYLKLTAGLGLFHYPPSSKTTDGHGMNSIPFGFFAQAKLSKLPDVRNWETLGFSHQATPPSSTGETFSPDPSLLVRTVSRRFFIKISLLPD